MSSLSMQFFLVKANVLDARPVGLLTLVILPVLTFLIYRLYLHPLASHPGHILSKLSAWPNWYHAAKGDRHTWLHDLHARYGPVVRFTPNSLSFNTVSAIDLIYKSRKANAIKSDWYQCVRDSAGGFESTFTARDRVRHGVKRRLLSYAFSEKALKDYEPVINKTVGTWLSQLEQEANSNRGGAVDLGRWSEYLIFDILGQLCFSKSFGLLESSEGRYITKLVPQATRSWYTLGYHPLTHALRYLLFKTRLGPYIGGQSYRDNRRFRDYCLSALKERRGRDQADQTVVDNDMFHHLLNGRDPETGQAHSIADLACESVLLMVAGSQSTSGALAATIHYLVNRPETLARLQDEVRNAFPEDQTVRYEPGSQLAQLPYLRACIDESLRLTPPTPGHLPRKVLTHGLEVDGVWVAPGTTVGVSAYSIHRNETYFSDPYDFRPERWLNDDGSYRGAGTAFNAFSAGATGCIGKQLAYMELSLAVAMLIRRFNIQVDHPGGAKYEYQLSGSVPNGGYVASVILRAVSLHLAERGQPDTISAHFEYVRRTEIGPAVLVIEEVKLGQTMSTVQVIFHQHDVQLAAAPWFTARSRRNVLAYVTNTGLSLEKGLTLATGWSATPPPRPVSDFGLLARDRDPHWVRRRAPLDARFTSFVRTHNNLEHYVPREGTGTPRRGVVDLWLRLKGTGQRFTNHDLGYVADAYPMVVQGWRPRHDEAQTPFRSDETFWYPTLSLNLDVKRVLPEEGAEWLFVRPSAKVIQNGRLDLGVVILDQHHNVVALSNHVNIIVSAERSLMERSHAKGKI
ncbi:hypothetical protein FJTKL_08721 [Diaporthe vaccinii]|uniref:Uncharacterized protein n=1 Tax=Diaporthe vaccinii TaxID=105482 RepID=A0ABR4EQQ4_9PEZI